MMNKNKGGRWENLAKVGKMLEIWLYLIALILPRNKNCKEIIEKIQKQILKVLFLNINHENFRSDVSIW